MGGLPDAGGETMARATDQMIMGEIFTTLASTPPQEGMMAFKDVMSLLGWVSTFTVAVIGALYCRKARLQGREEGKNAMTIAPQPLIIAMEKEFVTRGDFNEFKASTKEALGELKGLFHATMTKVDDRTAAMTNKIEERDKALTEKIDSRDERLTLKIEKVAQGAYESRGKIHQKVNDQGERLRSLEDRVPVKRPAGH